MSAHKSSDPSKSAKTSRAAWLDDKTETPLIDDYAKRLGSFLDAMADGRVDRHELKDQEKRLVALMKAVEPKLDDELHGQMTALLCELTAYNVMQTVHELASAARPKTKFRG
jgi:hypothetical protein